MGSNLGALADPIGAAGEAIGIDNASSVSTAQTVAGEVLAGPDLPPPDTSLEDFIRSQTPEVQRLISESGEQAVQLTGEGLDQAITGLTPFADLRAFEEEQALLGLSGEEAQRAAIAGIPLSEARLAAQESQLRTQARQQSALGSRGGGAALLAQGQLQGAQASENIMNRLAELGSLSDIARASRAQISGLTESARARQTALLGDIGSQTASLLLGTAPAITQARTSQAELAGLQDIARANQEAALLSQVGQLASRIPATPSTPGTADLSLTQPDVTFGSGAAQGPFGTTSPAPNI